VTRNIAIALLVLLLSTWVWPVRGSTRQGESKSLKSNQLRAGACAVDIAPVTFPVFVNGGFLQNRATRVVDPVRAKCLVLDDGSTRLAIVVVDSCMMPRELLDRAKELARQKTGIQAERILISATHTHSAPAAMGALGCPADADYMARLPGWIAESIGRATKLLEPARVGWNVIDDHEHTFCRRWIRRPEKMLDDPFGKRTVRANMHPGYENPDAIAPAGPVDPGLTVLSVQSRTGRPIAVLANYSMHYFGAEPVSADYFGRFAVALAKRIGAQAVDPPFVGIMSQGTSGDQMWMDYGQPKKDLGIDAYADAVARFTQEAYQAIRYRDWVSLSMTETRLMLARRVPNASRLAWAREIVGRMARRDIPNSLPEVYAKEAIFLHEEPRRELKLQAIRIGELGIAAIPNEVFAITGLKIKAQSPLTTTMNIELANGSEGYIPPPEQHALGGYTTWPARTAAIDVHAEPRIVETVLGLLEKVADKPRRKPSPTHGPYSESVVASRPMAFWRLDDIQGSTALDSSGNGRQASYEGGVAFYLPGASLTGLSTANYVNRATYLAGGRLTAKLQSTGKNYSVELWFWSGLPAEVQPMTAHLFSLGSNGTSEHVGIRATDTAAQRLFFSQRKSPENVVAGKTEIAPRRWHHLALAHELDRVTVYLDGNAQPEIKSEVHSPADGGLESLTVGGQSDDLAHFEGKVDEVAVDDRSLPAREIAEHVRAAGGPVVRDR
jgi:Concanavalin A-like lectin/glucanases superfamily